MHLNRCIFCKFGIVIATNRSMKKIVLLMLIVVLGASISNAQKKEGDLINWVSFEEALSLQKKNPKKIMMDVYTVWCGPCKMLDRNTFKNPDVADYVNEHYYAVKFNAQGEGDINYNGRTFSNPGYDPAKAMRRNATHQLALALKVRAFPTIIFFDEESKMIAPIQSYKTPQQLELYLKLFKDDDYKAMKSQEDFNTYYSAFQPTFKG